MIKGPDDIFLSLTLGIAHRKIQKKPISSCSRSEFSLALRKHLASVRFSDCNKKKQEACFDLLYRLVPGAGLEPAQALLPTGF